MYHLGASRDAGSCFFLSLGSNHAAEDLFQDVLRRKDRADATRNALGVLHRFKWLFNLPHTIDTNITKVIYFIVTIYHKSEILSININIFS